MQEMLVVLGIVKIYLKLHQRKSLGNSTLQATRESKGHSC